MQDFDKDIVKTITKKKGSVIASEKVLRYMEDRIRYRVSGENIGESHQLLSFCSVSRLRTLVKQPVSGTVSVSNPPAYVLVLLDTSSSL